MKAKTNIIPVERNKIGVGISGSASWDLLTGNNTGMSINMPVTFQVAEPFKININGGWLWDRANDIHYATWGAGFEWQFAPKFTLMGEAFGQLGSLPAVAEGEPPSPNSICEPRLQAGLRFTPVENIDLDVIYGRNITGEDANWITAGLNVRF